MAAPLLQEVLRALAANRVPGLHFAGHLLGVTFEHVGATGTRLWLDAGPHLADDRGELHPGALAMLADFALATCMRAILEPHQRLATVSLGLELTAAPRTGRIQAVSDFHGFVREGRGRIGKAQVAIRGPGGEICFGTGAFMALDPPASVTLHPVPFHRPDSPPIRPLQEAELTAGEQAILARAKKAAATPHPSFLDRFWGYLPRRTKGGAACSAPNGPHIGNRVGHAQGGVLLGLAASTAACALPDPWRLSGMSAWYVRPGEGPRLRANAQCIHQGRLTALMRTSVRDAERRSVIEVITTHAHR